MAKPTSATNLHLGGEGRRAHEERLGTEGGRGLTPDPCTLKSELLTLKQQTRTVCSAGGNAVGSRERSGGPGCHEEPEARMVKVNLLVLSAPPRQLLYPWPDPPTPLLVKLVLIRDQTSLPTEASKQGQAFSLTHALSHSLPHSHSHSHSHSHCHSRALSLSATDLHLGGKGRGAHEERLERLIACVSGR